MEEILIKNIENGIRAIRLGNKTPIEANLAVQFNKLLPLNKGMYDDLMEKYKRVVEDYKNRKSNEKPG